ncbi:MAG: DUF1592 domain-containing protein [Myxococcota bacterium]
MVKQRTLCAPIGWRYRALAILSGVLALAGCGDDVAATSGDTETGSGSGGTADSSMADGTDGTTEGGSQSDGQIEGFMPGAGGMRKLTVREYRASVDLMLGPAAAAAAIPPADIGQDGFDAVGASILPLAADSVELYERSAAAVADAVISDLGPLQALVPCVSANADAACYREVATSLGRLAYRHTLSTAEVDSLANIAAQGQRWGAGAFLTGLRYELMAILQAPSFLYVQEIGEPDPEGSEFRRLTASELATRMSLFLTGHTPTLELLDAAEAGMLDTSAQIRAQAELMVGNPEARTAMESFFGEALRLRRLAEAPKNAEIFPQFSPELGEMMKDETLLLVADIIWNRDADYRTLFDADYTFVNDPLAALYGMDPPGTGSMFTQVQWPEQQHRAGYTSQASFLTWQSGPRRNSPTKRGLYVQERILCQRIQPPDPDAELELPDSEDLTLKELLEMHLDNDGCRGCHALTDPIGFAFESYTAIGAFRTTDNGKPVETDGEIADIGAWNNAKELGEILAQDPRTGTCLVRNLVKGTLGQRLTAEHTPGIDDLGLVFADSGYRVQALLVDMTAHPLFRLVDEPK